ncbi:hypothetical protein [Vibrio splendidus]|uniref:hypothetical protein n=1 Tax=Vibrio splendidus TaxID=29497 RepID=UPI000D3DAB65|nr:hypothetical protein [Vibrio splendidus]PTP78631.1 hypothetical protein CWO06_05275 [Vibrio splendidus]
MKTRITIDVEDRKKTVVSITENQNNFDLNIHVTSNGRIYRSENLRDLVSTRPEEEYVTADKYISVHNGTVSSANSMIKRTTNYKDGKNDTQVHVTGAIKTSNTYVPALFRVCGDLSNERYTADIDETDNVVSLGSYTPKNNQLRFMLVVSDKDKPFTPDEEHPSNNHTIQFEKFSVTIIWSYLNYPSHPHAIDFFLTTTVETGPSEGWEWGDIYNLYTDLNMDVAKEYFEVYETSI